MPLSLPVLDDRTFEQLVSETKRRIPVHTPEWTNFNVESDPGITLVELFAFLTENLLYRANRIPERNRLKFLQLLGIPLQPPAAAEVLITITNERGPVEPLPLDRGIAVTAGAVSFLTRDGVTVLPVEAQVYYKRKIPRTDPSYEAFKTKYQMVLAAKAGESEEEAAATSPPAASPPGSPPEEGEPTLDGRFELDFYETTLMTPPAPSAPNPVVDVANSTIDRALYLALLAPKNVDHGLVREALAGATLSIGVVPALADDVPPLPAGGKSAARSPVPRLLYEIADVQGERPVAQYTRLATVQEPDVLNEVGIAQIRLPAAGALQTWSFPEPMEDGTGDFPPRIEDDEVRRRLVTWIRLRLPAEAGSTATLSARLTWVGINAARVTQAVPVVNEPLGRGTGAPDQSVTLANRPALESSVVVEIQDGAAWTPWRRVDDLLAAEPDDQVFAVDPESGQLRFGAARPPAGSAIRVSYEYGGGRQGNVGIGAIKASPDLRLQGGFKIENPLPTWGGDEGETVAEGERNIPLYLRHRDRLVTERDFEDVTRRAPGVDVGRVAVLPLFHPDAPQSPAPGVVTVMVIPKYDAQRPRWPSPDRLFLRKVCEHLDPRRLVTTEVHVRGPHYVPVYVSVGVQIRGGHVADVVLQDVRRRLEEYLSALPPGGPDEQGWPLGKRLLKKDLEAVVTRVRGVEFVTGLELATGTVRNAEAFDLAGLDLPLLVRSSVREGDAEPIAAIIGGVPSAKAPTVVPVPVSRAKC